MGFDQWWEESGRASRPLTEIRSLDRGATNVLLNSVKLSDFQITEEFELSSLDVALASFWQLARNWQKGEVALLEISCEAGSLNIQLNVQNGSK